MSPMIPKDQEIYNLHFDYVRGDVLRPPHGTTSTAMNLLMTWKMSSGEFDVEIQNKSNDSNPSTDTIV